MHNVIHEVEPDRQCAGEARPGAELGQRKRRIEHPVGGERVEHVRDSRSIGAAGIGRHGIGDAGGLPYGRAVAIAMGRGGEPTMLRRHVGEQLEEVPARAGRRPAQIVARDGRNDVDGRQHDGSVDRSDISDSIHTHIICIHISLVNVYAFRMAPRGRRPDLAAMLGPLVREMIAAEVPVLEAHGLSMWGYIVLGALGRSPVRSQAALAEAIGADKTRIIPTLDDLQDRGYIERRPDPDDRRVRLLAITQSGRAAQAAAQEDIQRGEERWLGKLSADDRRLFLRVLRQLSATDGG